MYWYCLAVNYYFALSPYVTYVVRSLSYLHYIIMDNRHCTEALREGLDSCGEGDLIRVS